MVELAKWVDLKFSFDYPIGKFPALIERLRGTSIRLEDFVKELTTNQLTKKENEKWSIQEHVGHLIDLEALLGSRINDFESNVEVLTPADMSNAKTYAANYNTANITNLLNEFKTIRLGHIEKLEKYNNSDVAKTALHPRLNKPMRLVDLAYFFAEHDDHHLAIMRRLINI